MENDVYKVSILKVMIWNCKEPFENNVSKACIQTVIK